MDQDDKSDSDPEWPESSYSMTDRANTIKTELAYEEPSRIRPFCQFDAEFVIALRSAKWFASVQKIQDIRNGWKHKSWFSSSQTEQIELLERQKAAKLIQLIGQQLFISKLCIDNSVVFMHRFYIFHPIQMFPHDLTACAAIFLSAKSENQPRSSEMIIKALLNVFNREVPPNDNFESFKKEVIETENFMAATFGFDFSVQLPDRYIHAACKLFNITNVPDLKTIEVVASNSLFLTTFCIRYPPKLIAAFSIHLSSQWSKYKISDSAEGKPWFFYVDGNITLEMLDELKKEFMKAYEEAPKNFFNHMQIQDTSKQGPLVPAVQQSMIRKSRSCQGSCSDNTEEDSDGCKVRRGKFEAERTSVSSFKKPFLAHQSPSQSCSSSRLLPQQHLYRTVKPMQLIVPQVLLPLESLSTLEGTNGFSVNRADSRQNLPSNSDQVSRAVSCPNASSELLVSTYKGIRSTVPLKIKPPKAVEKLVEMQPQKLNEGKVVDDPGVYTACKTSKLRISHFSKPVAYDQNDEPDIHHVVLEETFDEFQTEPLQPSVSQKLAMNLISSKVSSAQTIETDEQSTKQSKQASKLSINKPKKSRSKKKVNKHKLKLKLKKISKMAERNGTNRDGVQSDVALAPAKIPLRLTIQKSDVGVFMIKK